MRNRSAILGSVCFATIDLWLATISPASRGSGSALLSLDEAKGYLLELINRDRASLNLKPVELDPVASAMAQSHSEEMASQGYMAHWDRQGRGPAQRYTEHGGKDFIQENAFLLRDGGDIKDPVAPTPKPSFTRLEIESIEAAYFNQRPPEDSHRRNISRAEHTHVGIGLARAGNEFGPSTLANCQEFVNKYIEVDSLPRGVKIGDRIRISGTVAREMEVDTITVAREDAPTALSVSQLKGRHSYGVPAPYETVRPDPGPRGTRVMVKPDGRFSVDVELSDEGRPGLYYVTIKVIDRDGRKITASQRTVLVK